MARKKIKELVELAINSRALQRRKLGLAAKREMLAIERSLSKPQMSDAEFRALLNLVMMSYPSPIDDVEDAVLRNFLNSESVKRGFTTNKGDAWIVAFHDFKI